MSSAAHDHAGTPAPRHQQDAAQRPLGGLCGADFLREVARRRLPKGTFDITPSRRSQRPRHGASASTPLRRCSWILRVGPSVCGGLIRESPRVARVPLCVFAGQLLAHCSQADVPRAGCADLQKRIVAFARSPTPLPARSFSGWSCARRRREATGAPMPIRTKQRWPLDRARCERCSSRNFGTVASGGDAATAGSRSASLRPPSGVPWWRRAGFPASSIMLLHGFVDPLGIAGLPQSRRAPETAALRP